MNVGELFYKIWLFICEHYKEILYFIGFIIMLIISISKKKVKVVDALISVIYEMLPKFINAAELKVGAGSGEYKKQLVFDSVILYLTGISDLSRDELVEKYGQVINIAIENILETPQKKER